MAHFPKDADVDVSDLSLRFETCGAPDNLFEFVFSRMRPHVSRLRDIFWEHEGLAAGLRKVGRWGRIFPDKSKSHGQFAPKTMYKKDRQTDRKMDSQTDKI